jgi:hypothetical protein
MSPELYRNAPKTRSSASYRLSTIRAVCGYQTENFGDVGEINETRYIAIKPSSFRHDLMNPFKPETSTPSSVQAPSQKRQEVRCAVRFPLALPVVLSAGEDEIVGSTRNISASGVLFALEEDLSVGRDIDFSMRMPRAVLGAPQDVLVHCKGRVVRCSTSHNEHLAAATIDDYRFVEQ